MNRYLELMRVTNYVKNLIIALPIFFGGMLFELDLLLSVVLGIASFCFLSSAVYIINDIHDIDRDRNHGTKRHRPLASGRVGVKHAKIMAVLLIIASVAMNISAFRVASRGDHMIFAFVLLALYFLINLGYSRFGWKNIPVVDLSVIASGFLFRIIYGSVVTGIELSNWMILVMVSLSFYLSMVKRKNEKVFENTGSREVLKHYSVGFLEKNMYVCLTLSIVFYALWAVDPVTIAGLGSEYIVWTVPLVIILCMRYGLIVDGASRSDTEPIGIALRDGPFLIVGAILLAVLFVLAYGQPLFGDVISLWDT
jgi:4-hydroxybenzoate polyprenyltransferase